MFLTKCGDHWSGDTAEGESVVKIPRKFWWVEVEVEDVLALRNVNFPPQSFRFVSPTYSQDSLLSITYTNGDAGVFYFQVDLC